MLLFIPTQPVDLHGMPRWFVVVFVIAMTIACAFALGSAGYVAYSLLIAPPF
jgi:hypothetical protein